MFRYKSAGTAFFDSTKGPRDRSAFLPKVYHVMDRYLGLFAINNIKSNHQSQRRAAVWRDAHLMRSKFNAENFSAANEARSKSGELSRNVSCPSTSSVVC